MSRSRILFVARYIPYEPASGGLVRTFHLLRAASTIADITLVGADVFPDQARVDMARELATTIHIIPAREPQRCVPEVVWATRPRVASTLEGVVRLIPSNPFSFSTVDAQAVRRTVILLLKEKSYDALVTEYTEVASALANLVVHLPIPSIADFQNVDSAVEIRRQNLLHHNADKRRFSVSGWRSVQRLRSAEQHILHSYSHISSCSPLDADMLHAMTPQTPITEVPNGVDISYFGEVKAIIKRSDQPTVIYTGNLQYPPSFQSVLYFVTHSWPIIRHSFPNARFWIVGFSPVPEIVHLSGVNGIEVFGSVPDVRPYLAQSDVVVAPILLGGGTRLKILEALAAQRPVVSTTLGAEGLRLTPNRDLVLADSPADMAHQVINLLDNPVRRADLATHGFNVVQRLYDWHTIEKTYAEMLANIIVH